MSLCTCRTIAFETFFHGLTGLAISSQNHLTQRTRQQQHLRFSVCSPAARQATQLHRRHHPQYASTVGNLSHSSGHRDLAARLSIPSDRPLDHAATSTSAIKKSFRTDVEETARREKRLAKKIQRVKDNKFPRNKHRIRVLDQLYNISPTTRTRLQRRYHREKSAIREGEAAIETADALSPSKGMRWNVQGREGIATRKHMGHLHISQNARHQLKTPSISGAVEQMLQSPTQPAEITNTDTVSTTKLPHADYDDESRKVVLESLSVQESRRDTATTILHNTNEDEEMIIHEMLEDIRLGRTPSLVEGSDIMDEMVDQAQDSTTAALQDIDGRHIAAVDQKTNVAREQTATTHIPSIAATGDASATSTDAPTTRPAWAIRKEALREKFGTEGWRPRKKLSPDSLNGIRALHDSNPDIYSVPVLSTHLRVSPEAVRRILKSNWRPSEKEIEDRRERWVERGKKKRAEIEEHLARRKLVKTVRNHDLQRDFQTTLGQHDLRQQ